MLKKLGMHAVIGFSATAMIQIVIMFIMAQSGKHLVTEGFSAYFSGIEAAVIAQLGLVCMIGVAFACGSLIFEIERWSYLLQGAVHFVLTAAVWMPVAWFCWRPTSAQAALFAALGWLFTYAVNWFAQYLIYRRNIMKLNESIASYKEVDANE